jgi:hypothetical protein
MIVYNHALPLRNYVRALIGHLRIVEAELEKLASLSIHHPAHKPFMDVGDADGGPQ